MSTPLSFLIVDDHPVIGFAMDLLLKKHFMKCNVDKAKGGREAIQCITKSEYDLVILDVNLPDYDILDLVPNLLRNNEDQKILVFTMTPENILAKRLFSLSVMGFLSKDVEDDEIILAIRKVLKGTRYVSEEFSKQMMESFITGKTSSNPFDLLSDREYQILRQILAGNAAKEIGENMSLHHSSVTTYKTRIYKKLNIENQIQLFEIAKAFGVI